MTEYLRQQLLEIGDDPDQYIKEFVDWKSRGPAGENDHYWFGKDGAYDRPRGSSSKKEYILWHVHLAPTDDSKYAPEWDRAWNRGRGRRVSDTSLVYTYADGGNYGYLLIAVLWEPEAHDVIKMKTQEARELMQQFAEVAERFRFDGTIDA